MPKVKNTSGIDLLVPGLNRLVLAGQVIDVTDEQAEGLLCQDIWSEAKEAKPKD